MIELEDRLGHETPEDIVQRLNSLSATLSVLFPVVNDGTATTTSCLRWDLTLPDVELGNTREAT
jgi:hypothetical protein